MNFAALFRKHQHTFAQIVPLETSDKLYALDLTTAHTALTREILDNASAMTAFIQRELERTGTRYAIGGYAEHRNLYDQYPNFGSRHEEPRRLHLGIDIWGSAGTPVFAPLGGRVHSFKNNAAFGDYGGTIILHHELDGASFHTLYGHLALRSLEGLYEGKTIGTGERLAEFGEPHENGNWSPHLHFQVICDMEDAWGDYAGVCRLSERERYLANCPDPDGILGLNQFCA
ncbi:MAG: peptidoglycan DD-metalloendopeptidase family protein [Ignavibacteria bacterium]|nr:peptidoglycan DD-metalloendopeptidase family protein [Ignavibacteria bacterium]